MKPVLSFVTVKRNNLEPYSLLVSYIIAKANSKFIFNEFVIRKGSLLFYRVLKSEMIMTELKKIIFLN